MNKLANILKKFTILVNLKRVVWGVASGYVGLSLININKNFPAFQPFSAGRYRDRAKLTIQSINSTIESYVRITKYSGHQIPDVVDISTLAKSKEKVNMAALLRERLTHYGSDKASKHGFHLLYAELLHDRESVSAIFEVGLGSNSGSYVSNMSGRGVPGGSLRAFRDCYPNSIVYGADIDREVLFSENRIQTFYIDQTDIKTFEPICSSLEPNFDLVIDDGLHTSGANLATLEFGLRMVRAGGWVIIEDIGFEALDIWILVSAILPKSYERKIYKNKHCLIFAVRKVFDHSS